MKILIVLFIALTIIPLSHAGKNSRKIKVLKALGKIDQQTSLKRADDKYNSDSSKKVFKEGLLKNEIHQSESAHRFKSSLGHSKVNK